MLNYANLSDVEFEALCRDLMSRRLGVELRRFAPGRDGGVDLTDDTVARNIVVQVKHYQKSDIATLLRSLEKELDKVRTLGPGAYYICCSRALTAANIAALRSTFGPYLPDDSHVLTITEIDDLLKSPDYRDILRKHVRLWLDDAGLVREFFGGGIFADCQGLLRQIRREYPRFVETTPYRRALQSLGDNRVLMLVGNPGVGKTTTSKMLVLHYAALGYRIRYTSAMTQISRLKAALDPDPDAREVILLDDCFGQAYFEMSYTQSGELMNLISYVNDCPNRILILNSRVTIYREARERDRELADSLEYGEYRVQVIDMEAVTPVEKALILYNHLTFSGLSEDYLEQIRRERRYARIIEHENYNPRIIEFVCTPSRLRDVPAEEFFGFIMKHLQNPRQMWKDEYDHKLQSVDRILLQTVYSLTNTTVELGLLRHCFEYRIAAEPGIDRTIDQFEASLRRLTDGFIRISHEFKGGDDKQPRPVTTVGMINPSVNDFLDHLLDEAPSVRQAMVDGICCINQFRRLLDGEGEMLRLAAACLEDGRADGLIFPDESERRTFIFWTIASAKLKIGRYRDVIWSGLREMHLISLALMFSDYEGTLRELVRNLLSPELWAFYGLEQYFSQKGVLDGLMLMGLDELIEIINLLDPLMTGEGRKIFIEDGLECLRNTVERLWYKTLWGGMFMKGGSSLDGFEEEFFDVTRDDLEFKVRAMEQAVLDIDVAHLMYCAGYLDENGTVCEGDRIKFNKLLFRQIRQATLKPLKEIFSFLPADFLPILDILKRRTYPRVHSDRILRNGLDHFGREHRSCGEVSAEMMRRDLDDERTAAIQSIDDIFRF